MDRLLLETAAQNVWNQPGGSQSSDAVGAIDSHLDRWHVVLARRMRGGVRCQYFYTFLTMFWLRTLANSMTCSRGA